MDAANALISALGGEEVRWKAQAAQFSDTISRLIGDCAIASRWAGRGRLGVLGLGAVAQQLCLGSKLQPSPAWCHIARNPAATPLPLPSSPSFVSYLGPFNKEFRELLLTRDFYGTCVRLGIPCTKDLEVRLGGRAVPVLCRAALCCTGGRAGKAENVRGADSV